MKLAPFSIAKLMVVVVAVAINLAIVRLLAAYSPVLPVAVAWTGLALQAGGLAVILGRGRARAFSVGFITFGAIALATVIWAMVFATNTGIAYDPSTGKTTTITIPGSPLWTLWSNYFEFVGSFLVEKLQVNIDPEGFLAAVIWALPQLLIALAGGAIALLLVGRRHTRTRRASGDSRQSAPPTLISARI